jgi:hypothetical protein
MHPDRQICLLFLKYFLLRVFVLEVTRVQKQRLLSPNDSTRASAVDISSAHYQTTSDNNNSLAAFSFKCELVGGGAASPDHSLSVLPIRRDKIATFA